MSKISACLRCLGAFVLVANLAQAAGAPLTLRLMAAPGAASATAGLVFAEAQDWSRADLVELAMQRRPGADSGQAGSLWLELCLRTGDGRWFASAEAIELRAGVARQRITVRLHAGAFSGPDGALSQDALRSVAAVELRAFAPQRADLHPRAADAGAADAGWLAELTLHGDGTPRPQVVLPAGLIDRGAWREARLHLADRRPHAGEISRGVVEIIAADGRRWPCFLDQPGEVREGRWRARGAPRFTLRLAADETPRSPLRVAWWDDEAPAATAAATWQSPPFVLPAALIGREAMTAYAGTLPKWMPSPAWRGRPVRCTETGFVRESETGLPSAAAPILRWNASWTGFRGAAGTAWPAALASDALLAEPSSDLDLLPPCLGDEQGAYRFGTSPWTGARGITSSMRWQRPADLWRVAEPWRAWRAHARDLVARARAQPGLQRFRFGLTATAHDDAARERLLALCRDVHDVVAAIDGRPLLILHPQAVDYERRERGRSGCWFGFEDGVQGWRSLLPGATAETTPETASEGRFSLRLPCVGTEAVRVVAAEVPCEADLFHAERIEIDACLLAPGASAADIQIYAVCTDRAHRWYQQRLPGVSAGDGWCTLGVDLTAAWEPLGHDVPWSIESRRLLRRLSVLGFCRGAVANAELRLDRIRRLGWPRERAAPQLAIALHASAASSAGAPIPVARYAPLHLDADLSLAAANPFDPEQADVVGEAIAPDGRLLRFPACWIEPQTLRQSAYGESAEAAGPGRWSWRFRPTATGAWQVRLIARVLVRKDWCSATSAWRSFVVSDRVDGPVPIRVSRVDPWYFEHEDGRMFYPLGPTLRSPGDERQDDLLSEVRLRSRRPGSATAPRLDSAAYDRLGTAAYASFFARFQAAQMNFARVWMAPWFAGLEWSRGYSDGFHGLTWYNQVEAARLDRVLDLAAAHGVFVQLELQNHGQTSVRVDNQWDGKPGDPGSPYRRDLGGMCDSPRDFYTSELAFATLAKRHRYVLARWGHRAELAALSLSSELEFTPWENETEHDEDHGISTSVAGWVDRSLAWFSAHDPWQRPVSIHFSHPWRQGLWRSRPKLAFGYSNAYTGFQSHMPPGRLGGDGTMQRDLPRGLGIYLSDYFPPWEQHRPTLIGEWGGHWSRNNDHNLRGELRTGLWSQAVMPFGGSTGFWWWLWLDAADRYSDYASVARFLAAEDPRGRGYALKAVKTIGTMRIIGMASPERHLYYAFLAGLDQNPDLRSTATLPPVRITTAQPGSTWRIERYDCTTGALAAANNATADSAGLLSVAMDVLNPDAAFKLIRTAPGR